MNQALLQDAFKRSWWIIQQQADGLTDADSVLTLPVRGNTFNWVLGHILVSRLYLLGVLGVDGEVLAPLLTAVEKEWYKGGSEAPTAVSPRLTLPLLLERLETTQTLLLTCLEEADLERHLPQDDPDQPPRTLASQSEVISWHETYHAGQLEILRQLAGTDDAIV